MKSTQARVCAAQAMLIVMLTLSVTTLAHAAEPSHVSSHLTSCDSPYKKKPVPPKQLQAIVTSHEQWLEQREKPEYRRADLCQADLRKAKIGRAHV